VSLFIGVLAEAQHVLDELQNEIDVLKLTVSAPDRQRPTTALAVNKHKFSRTMIRVRPNG
jgi:hypothetical protein